MSSSSASAGASGGAASSNGSDLADERYPNLVKINKNAHSKKVAREIGEHDEDEMITERLV